MVRSGAVTRQSLAWAGRARIEVGKAMIEIKLRAPAGRARSYLLKEGQMIFDSFTSKDVEAARSVRKPSIRK